ncbi:MAG TPA: hypothetical protein VGK44_16980 [Casimicrobiaceae bacterium]
MVFYDETGAFAYRCSGALITPTVFPTAGHCAGGGGVTAGTLDRFATKRGQQDLTLTNSGYGVTHFGKANERQASTHRTLGARPSLVRKVSSAAQRSPQPRRVSYIFFPGFHSAK